jgi:hypothetical protein
MHRHRKQHFGIIRAFQAKHGLFRYCGCRFCTYQGGTWRQNHSSLKYVTPTFLRPFDETRFVFETVARTIQSLWSFVV